MRPQGGHRVVSNLAHTHIPTVHAHVHTIIISVPQMSRCIIIRYRRNRIRNELMPYLMEHFNPRADEALARTAEVLQDEVLYLEQQAGELLRSCCSAPHEAGSSLGDSAEASGSTALEDPAASTSLSSRPTSRIVSVDRLKLSAAPMALQRRSLWVDDCCC